MRAKSARERVERICDALINDEVYQNKLKIRWAEGKIDPSLERLIWEYAARGKPREVVEVHEDNGPDLAEMTDEELRQHARDVQAELEALSSGPVAEGVH